MFQELEKMMGWECVTGRVRDNGQVNARARRRTKVTLEALEERRLLGGYGELFTVEPQSYSHAGGGAWLPNGGFAASWTTGIGLGYQAHVQVFGVAGAAPAQDAMPWQVVAGDVGVAADGHFVVVFTSVYGASVPGVWVRAFGADGIPSGDPICVATDGTNGTLAMAPDGRFAVAYARTWAISPNGTFVRRFDPTGTQVGPELSVSSTFGSDAPEVAIEQSGKMTFVWHANDAGVRARQMNWDGTFVGEEFSPFTGSGDVWNPRVAVDAAGRIAVTCVVPNEGVRLRLFDANRLPLGLEADIDGAGAAAMQDLAVAPDGQGVVIWAQGSMQGQRFDLASGTLVGSVLPVSPPGAALPAYPVVAMSSSGEILGVWRTTDSAFGGPVQAVTYGPGLPPTGISLSNANVDENAAGVLVGRLTVADPDVGDTFTYTLSGGHADLFTVVGDELRTAQPLDADTMPSVMVQVQAHDSSGWTFSQLVTITVNNVNEGPITLSLSNGGVVAENQPAGAVVGTLMAYDPDANDTLSYSLVSGDGDGGNEAFEIIGNQLRTVGLLDYETYSSYPIRVRVTDSGGLWYEQAMSVAVGNVNEAPFGLGLSNSLVQSDRPIGRVVAMLSARDPDAGSMLTYSLVSGDGATDNGLFQIVGNELQTKVMLSYPHASLSIRVRVADQGGLWSERAFALTVVEYNDPPTATFGASGPAVVGQSSANVRFTDVADSPGDMAGGFTYSYDFGNDGTFEMNGSNSAEATVPVSYLGVAGVVAIRGRVTDVRGAFSEYVTTLTVRQRPTAITGGPYNEQEGRPVTLNGSAVGLIDAGSARYEWDLNYDGVTFNTNAEGQEATFPGEALSVGTVRTVALRVWDGDGTSSEIATTTVRVVSAPPTATFGAVGNGTMGHAGQVRFAHAADSAADVAAGFRYSYDFDNDGTYDLVDSASAEVPVPGSYLGAPGVRTVRGRITDQSGAFSEYEAELIVSPPMEWYPLYPGLNVSTRKFSGTDAMNITIEYKEDEGGGILQHEVRTYGSETQYSDEHAVKVGTTWYLTSETYPLEDDDAGGVVTFSSPLPIWDEQIASGKRLNWSGITVPMVPLNDPELNYTAPTVLSGTMAKVRTGSVMLQNGTQFDGALLVKTQTVMTAPAIYASHKMKVTRTVTTQSWYVRGIGKVKSEQVTKVKVAIGGRVVPAGTALVWEDIREVPQWARFTTMEDGTLYVNGSEAADRIVLGVSGADLVVNRNGVYARTPLSLVQRVVVMAGDGSDVVDARRVGVAVEVGGGMGNDTIYGGLAGDRLLGDEGNDRLYGGDGNDSLTGGAGVDLLQGQNGDDWIDGHDDAPKEKISGGAGVDTAYVDVGEKVGAVEMRVEDAAPAVTATSPLLGSVVELDLGI